MLSMKSIKLVSLLAVVFVIVDIIILTILKIMGSIDATQYTDTLTKSLSILGVVYVGVLVISLVLSFFSSK